MKRSLERDIKYSKRNEQHIKKEQQRMSNVKSISKVTKYLMPSLIGTFTNDKHDLFC